MNAVDTNMLIYAHDPRDAGKQRIATQLVNSLVDGALLWQAACEYVAASRKLAPYGLFAVDAYDVLALRQVGTCLLPTWHIYGRAGRIMSNSGLAWWDALILAACAEFSVKRLYSEDVGRLRMVAGVEI
jgi:predicted nucleic acid-binding protein